MQQSNPTHDPSAATLPAPNRLRRRLVLILIAILALLLLAILPPLINVSRFQRRVARNIGASLGRPVHFDRLSFTLLPLPGFTLENFVVEEDPAFGFEPILRADKVRASLRIGSLWRRRVEFSKISLTDPSVNLVHTASGRWNLESILLQASRVQAAPTAQRFAGPAPRFPYIEATGARLNLKLDQVKTPFSLTDADFALWLPEPHQWHLRLKAHPIRTDTSPGDTGTLSIEGTLGGIDTPAEIRADSLARIPINLRADWRDAQLGGLTRLLLGRDAGLRGDLTLAINVLGTVGHNAIATSIQLANARRADFVPPRLLSLQANCNAIAQDAFHSFSAVECYWPPAGSSSPSVLILSAGLPDIRHPRSAFADVTLPALPAATLLDWIRVATPRPPDGLLPTGTLAGNFAWHPSDSGPQDIPTTRRGTPPHPRPSPPQPAWSGELELSGGSLQVSAIDPNPIYPGDVTLRSASAIPSLSGHSSKRSQPGANPAASFDLLPILLPLGGRQPATLEGHFDASGYTLHLAGTAIPARLLALGDAVPQFGDGLEDCLQPILSPSSPGSKEPPATPSGGRRAAAIPAVTTLGEPPPTVQTPTPIRLDLTATRAWGHPQTWRPTASSPPPPPPPTLASPTASLEGIASQFSLSRRIPQKHQQSTLSTPETSYLSQSMIISRGIVVIRNLLK